MEKNSINPIIRLTSSFLGKTIVVLVLIVAGLGVGLGVAFYATSNSGNSESENVPIASVPSENENIRKTEPVAAPPYLEVPQDYPQIILSSGSSSSNKDKRALLPNISFVAEQTKCDITKLLEWTRPGGGVYCAIPLRIAARTSEEVSISAQNQLVYGVPYRTNAPEGYRGTFFLEDEQAKRVILVKPGEARDVFLVVDVDKGFVGTTLVPQSK